MPQRGGELDLAEVVPRLVRFYGGSPREWLDMPMSIIVAHMQMLPRLRAEELLDTAKAAAVGRWLKRSSARDVQRDWIRQARAAPMVKATTRDVAAIGIGVTVAPPKRRRRREAG